MYWVVHSWANAYKHLFAFKKWPPIRWSRREFDQYFTQLFFPWSPNMVFAESISLITISIYQNQWARLFFTHCYAHNHCATSSRNRVPSFARFNKSNHIVKAAVIINGSCIFSIYSRIWTYIYKSDNIYKYIYTLRAAVTRPNRNQSLVARNIVYMCLFYIDFQLSSVTLQLQFYRLRAAHTHRTWR